MELKSKQNVLQNTTGSGFGSKWEGRCLGDFNFESKPLLDWVHRGLEPRLIDHQPSLKENIVIPYSYNSFPVVGNKVIVIQRLRTFPVTVVSMKATFLIQWCHQAAGFFLRHRSDLMTTVCFSIVSCFILVFHCMCRKVQILCCASAFVCHPCAAMLFHCGNIFYFIFTCDEWNSGKTVLVYRGWF